MIRHTIYLSASLLLALSLLQGCKVGPDYVGPKANVPDVWHQRATEGLAAGESQVQTWWRVFEDATLDDLIQRAGANNLNLRQALTRIRQARALRGVARGEYFPDVDATGGAARAETSDDFLLIQSTQKNPEYFYDIGFDATWEIDVWGRIARSVEAADADLQASFEDFRDILVMVYAEVAINYFELRAVQDRIRFVEQNIATQTDTVKLTEDRLRAQIAPELDVRQAELNLSRSESILPRLRQKRAQTVHRIGVLLGEHPGALDEPLNVPGTIPSPPESIAVGLPIDLIRQRPDIRRAERELAAQTARIGVRTADLYPRFSLSGAFAFDGTSDVFDAGKRNWNLGGFFRWNLFDGGRVRNRVAFEKEASDKALARWQQTVLRALEEVENAIAAYREERVRRDALKRSVVAARQSAELVRTLYTTGLTDFQNLLSMERSLLVQEDALAESNGLVVQNLVALYRALGGGWQPLPEALGVELKGEDSGG